MTIGELQKFIDTNIASGELSSDTEVFTCANWLSYDDTEIFEASVHHANHPCYDSKNPTKRVLMIGRTERIPNRDYSHHPNNKEGDIYKEYGTGADIIIVENKDDDKNIEYLIAKNKLNHLVNAIKKYEIEHGIQNDKKK